MDYLPLTTIELYTLNAEPKTCNLSLIMIYNRYLFLWYPLFEDSTVDSYKQYL